MAKFCKNCGKEVNEGADVCLGCGANVSDNAGKNLKGNSNVQKSKIAAGVLAILVGALGVHNFYLGYTGKGVAQLLITILTCGIGAPISAIWAFIEGIMILTGSINTDANGNPLSN